MSIVKEYYGKMPNGQDVSKFTLTNRKGMVVGIINYGGAITSLFVPDRTGQLADVVLGFDGLEGYLDRSMYFGALIGRFANRIANASFDLNGVSYHLNKNEGENHLHGGFTGFDKVVWNAVVERDGPDERLVLAYVSPDGEEHYPGTLKVQVTYALNDDNALSIHYVAVSDKDTVINLTNHSYFNLAGHASGTVESHVLTLNAASFTPVWQNGIPTGEIRDVANTPMDFTRSRPIGPGLASGYEQIDTVHGYDHNFVLDVGGKTPEKAAELYEPSTGRVMETFTTQPAVQFYTGNFLDGSVVGKEGCAYPQRSGLCLETQTFPNGMNCEGFPSPILKAGDRYDQTTIYRFSTR